MIEALEIEDFMKGVMELHLENHFLFNVFLENFNLATPRIFLILLN